MEAMVTLGILSVVGLGMSSLLTSVFTKQKLVINDKNLDALRETVLNTLQNDQAFTKTLKNPINANVFSCINSASDCRGVSGEFKIFDKNDTPLVLSTLSTETTLGFDSAGVACSNYNVALGNDDCPFKYVAVWSAECFQTQNIKGKVSTETACRDPLITIAVTFYASPKNSAQFAAVNPNKMKVAIVKSQNDASLADQGLSEMKMICSSMLNGTFDSYGSTCILPTSNPISCEGFCGAGQQTVVTGFNADGTPKCSCSVAATKTTCNDSTGTVGRVLSIANINGSLVCNDGIVPVLMANGSINNAPVSFNPPPPAPAPQIQQPAIQFGGGDGGGDGGDGGGG